VVIGRKKLAVLLKPEAVMPFFQTAAMVATDATVSATAE